jgi:DNA-binding protein YbaB
VARVREELARKTVEGETGGGLCRCTCNGRGEVLSLTIDPSIAGDKKMIEDLAVGAINIALARARELAEPTCRAPPADAACRRAVREADGCSRRPSRGSCSSSASSRYRREDRGAPGVPHPARLARGRGRARRRDRRGQTEDPVLLVCCDLTETDPCAVCRDARRDAGVVCVVAQPQDVVAIERTGGYRGRYHVLHGVLSPLDGIGPDDLRVTELVARCAGRPGERRQAGIRRSGRPSWRPAQRRG